MTNTAAPAQRLTLTGGEIEAAFSASIASA